MKKNISVLTVAVTSILMFGCMTAKQHRVVLSCELAEPLAYVKISPRMGTPMFFRDVAPHSTQEVVWVDSSCPNVTSIAYGRDGVESDAWFSLDAKSLKQLGHSATVVRIGEGFLFLLGQMPDGSLADLMEFTHLPQKSNKASQVTSQ